MNPAELEARLDAIREDAAALEYVGDPYRMQTFILDALFELIPAKQGAILLNWYDVPPDSYEFRSVIYRQRGGGTPEEEFELNSKALDTVYTAMKPCMSNDGLPAIMCAPLVLPTDEMIGVIYLHGAELGEFDPADMGVLKKLSDAVAELIDDWSEYDDDDSSEDGSIDEESLSTNSAEPVSAVIPEEVVEAVCREVEGYSEISPNHVRQYINEILGGQPALCGFVAPFCKDLSVPAERLVGFILGVTIRMFQIHFGKRLTVVSPFSLGSIFKDNAALFDGLLDRDEHISALSARELNRDQPWVWKYVKRIVMKSDDPNLNLTAEDRADLALVMKTVIDALNRSVSPNRQNAGPG
jgi:GAF domain